MRALAAALALSLAPMTGAASAQNLDYASVVVSDVPLSRSEQYVSRAGAALHGYDAVAYHTTGEATPGDPAFALEYNGAVWLFASQANRDRFAADPAAHAPAFDGHCAFAAARGSKAAGHPLYWHVQDGVLFLNVNAEAQSQFLQDVPGNVSTAVTNWNEGSGGLFGGGPLFERSAASPLRDVEGEVDPA